MNVYASLGTILLVFCLGGCSRETPERHPPSTTTPPAGAVASTESAQHAAPAAEAVARNLVQWYAANMEKLPTDFILHADGADTTQSYAVNFPGAEAWMTALRTSGYFSESYLAAWRRYFRQQNDSLRAHPQNDGPAAGFEYDFILYSQEADTKAQELQAGTYTSVLRSPTRAVVLAAGPNHPESTTPWQELLLLELSRTAAAGWRVDAIRNPTEEELKSTKLDLPK